MTMIEVRQDHAIPFVISGAAAQEVAEALASDIRERDDFHVGVEVGKVLHEPLADILEIDNLPDLDN